MPAPDDRGTGLSPADLARPVRTATLDASFVQRAARALGSWFGLGPTEPVSQARIEPEIPLPARPAGVPQSAPPAVISTQPEPWMGPGKPLSPAAPPQDVAGRAFDYPLSWNTNTTPRRFEPISFQDLRNLAQSFELLRMCIETRKDQLSKLTWSVMPRLGPGEKHRKSPDERCRRVEKFLRRPDGVHDWSQWVRIFAEDMFVIDAATLYRRRDRAGRPYGLEPVDGATIIPLIDASGRRPLAPSPAYQQVLKGMPAINYTTDELTYAVRNPRSNRVYGYSPCEQVVAYANIGLRRMAGQLYHFSEGNVPEALFGVPETWTPAQIQEFQVYWDRMLSGNQANRARARFIPGGLSYFPTRPDGALTDPFDEWLARICCYAFSLPPFPFVKQVNRATAESMYDAALEEGLGPTITFIKGVIDREIDEFLGEPDLELVWDDVRKLDATEQQTMDINDVRFGVISIDDMRAKRGQSALGVPPLIWGLGPMGVLPVQDLVKAIEMGMTLPQPQMPDMMGMGGMPGAPLGGDPLAGAPPEVLAQLGIDPAAAGGMPPEGEPGEDVFDDEGEDGESAAPKGGARVLNRLRQAKGDPRIAAAVDQLRGRVR